MTEEQTPPDDDEDEDDSDAADADQEPDDDEDAEAGKKQAPATDTEPSIGDQLKEFVEAQDAKFEQFKTDLTKTLKGATSGNGNGRTKDRQRNKPAATSGRRSSDRTSGGSQEKGTGTAPEGGERPRPSVGWLGWLYR